MEGSKLVNKVLKSVRQFTIGGGNSREYGYIERAVREFYPERIPLGNEYSLLALKSALGNISYSKYIDIGIQSVTTGAMVLIAYETEGFRGLTIWTALGVLGASKLAFNDLIKWQMRLYGKNVELIKQDLKKEEGRQDYEGEEWKRGTNYNFSQDL